MASESPEKQHSYLATILIESRKDLSLHEIIAESAGGIVISLMAVWKGIAGRSELPELFFLCVGFAIAVPFIAFVFRCIFITPYRLFKDAQQELAELKKDQFKPLAVEASSAVHQQSPHDNLTEQVLSAKNQIADFNIVISNPNPTHSINSITVKVLNIEPPMVGKPPTPTTFFSGPSATLLTDRCGLDCAEFPLKNVANNTLQGGQSGRATVFDAKRQGEEIFVRFHWKEIWEYRFAPHVDAEHIVTVQVTCNGLERQLCRFRLSFSARLPQNVLEQSFLAPSAVPVFIVEQIP
jgi:hypothetical protein